MIFSSNGKEYRVNIGDEMYYINELNYGICPSETKVEIIDIGTYHFTTKSSNGSIINRSFNLFNFEELRRRKTIKNILL